MKIRLCYAITRTELHTDLIEDLSHILSYAREQIATKILDTHNRVII